MKYLILFVVATMPVLLYAQLNLEYSFETGTVYGHIIEDGEIVYSHSSITGTWPEFQVTLNFYSSNFQPIGSHTFSSALSSSFPYGISKHLMTKTTKLSFLYRRDL